MANAADMQPKTRLLLAAILAFGAASIRDMAMIPALVVLTLAVIAIARPSRGFIWHLRGPVVLAVAIVLVLPLFDTGPNRYSGETAEAALVMAARLLAIATMVLALLSDMSEMQLVAGLRGLRVPVLICDLAVLTLRYLQEVRAELARTRLARHLRGGSGGWRAVPEFGTLIAVMMIRALKRSERVWAAMRVRGYQGGIVARESGWRMADLWAVASAIVAALAFVVLGG